MAFEQDIKQAVENYAWAHIHDEAWHTSFFDFIDDPKLATRLGEEFISARYIYKIFWKDLRQKIGFSEHRFVFKFFPMPRSTRPPSITYYLIILQAKLKLFR